MSYSYHRALAEKEISSRNFCNLVDAAVMLYEEEYSQGESEDHTKTKKTPSEKEEEEEEEEKEEKDKRNTRANIKRNLNWGASTSSSRNPPVDDSETKKNPQKPNDASPEVRNPNPQPSLSIRVTQDSKHMGKSKRAKVETFSWKGREAPEWLSQLMKTMEGTELKLIFERNLFKTDVNPSESRLSMPFNELIRNDFLTPEEWRNIEKDINKKKKTGLDAILVDQRNEKWRVKLKRWEGKVSWSYALTSGWNDAVKTKGLKEGHDISIWSFRWSGVLCFALVTPLPPPSVAQSSSSSLALCL